ncbi:hypothetical protein M433DRAFT_145492 [Acidomyces richmondensis BFW]|nr:hypothetical protein M433DRAFT_145492 [Acidomyces richmondensis BFW]
MRAHLTLTPPMPSPARILTPYTRNTNQYGGYWLMTRYEDVKRSALHSSTYISSIIAIVLSDPRGIRRLPLNFDAPAHTPFRIALEGTLKPSRLKRIAVALEKHWLNLEINIAPTLAKTAAARLNEWRMRDVETTITKSTKVYEVVFALLADWRTNPRDPEDPVLSLLLENGPDGLPPSEEHIIGCLRQALRVGVVALPILIVSICNHLSYDQNLQLQLRSDPSLKHAATIQPREPITLVYASANRDPDIFDSPNEFILHRPNIAVHMEFGRGWRRCAGMPPARLKCNQDCALIYSEAYKQL